MKFAIISAFTLSCSMLVLSTSVDERMREAAIEQGLPFLMVPGVEAVDKPPVVVVSTVIETRTPSPHNNMYRAQSNDHAQPDTRMEVIEESSLDKEDVKEESVKEKTKGTKMWETEDARVNQLQQTEANHEPKRSSQGLANNKVAVINAAMMPGAKSSSAISDAASSTFVAPDNDALPSLAAANIPNSEQPQEHSMSDANANSSAVGNAWYARDLIAVMCSGVLVAWHLV